MKHRVLVAALSASVVAPSVLASGYKLNEQGASGAGNAYAGRAAVVEDATVVFYNPAGMVKLKQAEVTFGASYIDAKGSFELDSYRNGAGKTYTADNMGPYSDGGDFIPNATVPYAYYATPINEKIAAGLGIFVPFGTNTDYSNNFVGGGFADQTKLSSVEIQPAIAYRLNDQLSVGFGLDVTYMKGLLSKQVDTAPYNEAISPVNMTSGTPVPMTGAQWSSFSGFENHYEVSGDDWDIGYNLSFMWDINSDITLGVAYRSQMEFKLKGDSAFDKKQGVVGLGQQNGTYVIAPADAYFAAVTKTQPTGTIPNQASQVPLTTPQSLTISYAQQLTDKLQLVAGSTWTQWSVFKDFDVISTESQLGKIEALGGLGKGYIGHIEENWHDTIAVAVGANYQLNKVWLIRTGYANDQSPVSNKYRTARVPDNDREWISAGFNYRINNDIDVDFALSYLIFSDTKVDEYERKLDGEPKDKSPNLKGTYSMDAVGYSLQVNYKI